MVLGRLESKMVVVHIAEEQTAGGLVDDDADVAADPDEPEVLVPRLVQFVEGQAVRSG
jgi:hypothetical protein